MAVVALKARRRAIATLRRQHIARDAGSIHLLVQQACGGKAVEQAVNGDFVDGGTCGGKGCLYFGFGQRCVWAGLVQPRQRPRGTGGAHAGRERPRLGMRR